MVILYYSLCIRFVSFYWHDSCRKELLNVAKQDEFKNER